MAVKLNIGWINRYQSVLELLGTTVKLNIGLIHRSQSNLELLCTAVIDIVSS